MSNNFGDLVLVLGDLHIPERTNKIPEPLKRMLVPDRMQHVICTGNVGSSPALWNEIQQLAPSCHCVAGDFENDFDLFPETCVVQVGQFRIGVIHGHQLLPWGNKFSVERMRRKLRVDILVTGHTHQSAVFDESDGFYHINPVRRFIRYVTPHVPSKSFSFCNVSGIDNWGLFVSFGEYYTIFYFACRTRQQSCLLRI